ncbi:MAG: tetratricopeptide repeat protein, partial [Promethearchaeota archaeon]
LSNICEIHRRKGDLNQSLECYQEVLRTHREIGNNYHIAVVLHNIGVVYWQQGKLTEARQHLEQSLELRAEIENRIEMSDSLFFLISVTIDQGEFSKAQQYLGQLQEIRDQEDDKTVHQRYSVAEAQLLKTSRRTRDRVRAEEILARVVDEAVGDLEVTTLALLHLCDVLLVELRTSYDAGVLGDVQKRVGQLLELAKEQRSNWLLAETYVLQARLALIELDLQEARRLHTQAQIMADEHGLHRLAMVISREHDVLLKQLGQWEGLIERQASLQERIEMARLEELVVRMIRKRTEDIPEVPEEPVLLLILDKDGISLFSKHFISEGAPDEQLIAGFLAAIDGFSRVAFSASGSLERIKHQDYTLLMHAQAPLLFCYVFKGQSWGAQQRLNRFLAALKANDSVWHTLTARSKDTPIPDPETFEGLVTEIFQPASFS